ncbi:MAG: hypothetical protein AAF614_03265 [Chloroflexota bacterium]
MGASSITWKTRSLQRMGFNWMKIYEPPPYRQPINMLWRLEVDARDGDALAAYADHLRGQVRQYDNFVEAYEIGNEVNLRANGWAKPPDAAQYVRLLCRAYHEIKLINPNAIVVSAGLAPAGLSPYPTAPSLMRVSLSIVQRLIHGRRNGRL